MLIDYGGKFSFLERLKISRCQKALKGVLCCLLWVENSIHSFQNIKAPASYTLLAVIGCMAKEEYLSLEAARNAK